MCFTDVSASHDVIFLASCGKAPWLSNVSASHDVIYLATYDSSLPICCKRITRCHFSCQLWQSSLPLCCKRLTRRLTTEAGWRKNTCRPIEKSTQGSSNASKTVIQWNRYADTVLLREKNGVFSFKVSNVELVTLGIYWFAERCETINQYNKLHKYCW